MTLAATAQQSAQPPVDTFWALAWLLAILLVVWFLYRAFRRQRLRDEAEDRRREQEHQDKVQRLRDAGALLEDGQLKCIVCGRAPATERWPAVKRTKLDKDFFGHRKLHHHLPMYEVVDSDDKMAQVCKPHRRLIERKIELVLGSYRAQAAQLSAEVEQDLSRWEAGGLLSWAQEEAREFAPPSARRMNMLQLGAGQHPPMPSTPSIAPAEATPLHHQGGTVTLAPAEDDDGEAP